MADTPRRMSSDEVAEVRALYEKGDLLAAQRRILEIMGSPKSPRPRTLLGWLLGSDEAALRLIRRLGLEPFLLRCVRGLDGLLRRWPWLYRRLGGPSVRQSRSGPSR